MYAGANMGHPSDFLCVCGLGFDCFQFRIQSMTPQKIGQVLGEGGARHNHVTAGFHGLGFQVALQVGEETDHRSAPLHLALQARNQGKGLGSDVVQVEDDERGTSPFGHIRQPRHNVLVGFDERYLHADFPRGFLDLGEEKEVFDEAVDAGGCVFPNRGYDRLLGHTLSEMAVLEVAVLSVSTKFGLSIGSVGGIAVYHPVAVVHGSDECLLAALLAFAPASTVAAIVHGSVGASIAVLGREPVLPGRLRLSRLFGRMCLGGPLSSLGIGMTLCLVVCISFTSAAPATMPLPFTLTSRLGLIRLRLRLILLCHACTSRCVGNSCSLLMFDPPRTGEGRDRLQLMFPLG